MKRIKTGDKVRIMSGNLSGQEGIVLSVCNKCSKAIVEGLNKVKRHKKPSANQEDGGIKEKEAYITLSKLALVVPKSSTGVSKVKFSIDKTNKKVRVAKKTNNEIGIEKKK